MPNHVKNVIKLKNLEPEDIIAIMNTITTQHGEVPMLDNTIDFNKIIPEPESLASCPGDCLVNSESCITIREDKPWFDWYKFHIKYWGTKWNAYDAYTKINKTNIIFVFSTAWAAPMPIYHKLKTLNYDMEIRYADEDLGVNCGKLIYKKGEPFFHEEYSHDFKDPYGFANYIWNKY